MVKNTPYYFSSCIQSSNRMILHIEDSSMFINFESAIRISNTSSNPICQKRRFIKPYCPITLDRSDTRSRPAIEWFRYIVRIMSYLIILIHSGTECTGMYSCYLCQFTNGIRLERFGTTVSRFQIRNCPLIKDLKCPISFLSQDIRCNLNKGLFCNCLLYTSDAADE